MSQHHEATYLPYAIGATALVFRSLSDDVVVAEVRLGHIVYSGASRDDMIVTIGDEPPSIIIIHDRHVPGQQFIEALCMPIAVDISPAKDVIAVMLHNGLIGGLYPDQVLHH